MAERVDERTMAMNVARLFGIVFLLVGILGFVPGITTNYDDLQFAGDGSEAKLLGIFQVSILHNIVHLLFGVAGLAMSRTADGARTYLIGGGVIYLLLFLLGIVGAADWIPSNGADDILHLALGIGLLGAGLALTRDRGMAART